MLFGQKKMHNNCLHADYCKRHAFCKRAAKYAPLTVSGEAGVSTPLLQSGLVGKLFLKVLIHRIYLAYIFCHSSCNLKIWVGGNRAISYRKKSPLIKSEMQSCLVHCICQIQWLFQSKQVNGNKTFITGGSCKMKKSEEYPFNSRG
jgi:hypothetical protein